MNRLTLASALIFALFGATSAADDLEMQPRGFPADDLRAAQPSLSAHVDGVNLSWVEPHGEGHRLRRARWSAEGLGKTETVAEGADWFVNWADFPSLIRLKNGTEASFFLQRVASAPYAYGIRLLSRGPESADWVQSDIHDDSPTEHGFAALFDWSGDIGIVWLDGRNTDAAAHGHGHAGAMNLRAARVDSAGRVQKDWLLDERTCDCCQTDAALTDDGPILAYRDRSEAEIRDIAVVRWEGETWSAPIRVHEDGWLMPGCPVNGPAITATGQQVRVAWFTAAEGRARVLTAHSSDGGRQFGPPLTVAEGDHVLGRVDLVQGPDGATWISWLSETQGEQSLQLSRIDTDRLDPARVIAPLGRGRGTGVPRMAVDAHALYLAWTDTRSGQPRLRGQRLPWGQAR